MIVYADRTEELDVREILARLAGDPSDPDDRVSALLDAGALEAGLTDRFCPEEDELDPRVQRVRDLTLAAARRLLGTGAAPLPSLAGLDLPRRLRVSIPEGFAWYALDPEAWADAARELAARVRRGPVVVLGLRSIGTTLSAVVHAALEARGFAVRSFTVRPRGHPFDRAPRLGPRLAARLRERLVLVVDEGPGLSGSSLCGTAAAVSALGVPDRAVVLMPAWCPDGSSFVSASARDRWPRHPKIVADSLTRLDRRLGPGEDWSAGRWRRALGCSPPFDPRHERMKRVLPGGVARFAGLGRHGERVRVRAEHLADLGLGPAVLGLRGGFLLQERLVGEPLRRGDPRLPAAVTARIRAARVLPGAEAAPVDALAEMIAVNLGEAGLPVPRLDVLRAYAGEGTCAVDGRLQAHEWLATRRGVLKTDGHDHCEDHFFPGFQDPAWDVAGAAIELGPAVRDEVLARLGDPWLARRVPAYELAYAAFRLGYATFARDAAAGVERVRWTAELRRLRGEACRAALELR